MDVASNLKKLSEAAYENDTHTALLELTEVYLGKFATDSRILYLRAEAQRIVGLLEDAVSSYKAALSGAPGDIQWTIKARLGLLYSEQGNRTLAEEWFRRSLCSENASSQSWVWILRGSNLALAGQCSEAINCYRKAVAVDPEDSEAHLNLAYSLRTARKYEEALEHVRKVRSIDSESLEAESLLNDLVYAIKIVAKQGVP